MRLMTQIRYLFTAVCLLALSQSSVAFGQAVYGSIDGTIDRRNRGDRAQRYGYRHRCCEGDCGHHPVEQQRRVQD